MRINSKNNRSGIALIVVLIVIVVLGILAGGFAYSMKVETMLARHASFSTELDWLGRSGVEVAKWVLAQSSQGPNAQFDSLKQKWAGGIGETNDALAGVDLKNYPIYGPDGSLRGTLAIDIKDLDRKFNINRADPIILNQALTLIGVDAGAMGTVANSILDWIDKDKSPHMSGTESEVYEQQDPPYFAKDGPIDDLSELLLIRGVTPAMYWGTSGGGLPPIFNRPQGQKSVFEEPTYAVGLADLFTPLSGPGININTASATVLQMIPVIDENIAQAILQRRAGMDGQDGTEDDMPFRNPAELSIGMGGVPPAPGLQQFMNLFTTKSQVFEVHVTASIGSSKREYVAILRRLNPKETLTLSMYWK